MDEFDISERLENEGRRWRALSTPGRSLDASLAALGNDQPSHGWVRWAMPAAAAAAVVIALTATFTVISHPGRPATPPLATAQVAEVPWAANPVSIPPMSSPPAFDGSAVDGAPKCATADFTAGSVSAVALPGAASAVWTLIRTALTYRGDAPCRLSSRGPGVKLLGASGTILGTGEDTFDDLVSDALVRPGQLVLTGATWSSSCGMRETPTRLALTMGTGASAVSASLKLGKLPSPGCLGASDAYPVLGERPVVADSGSLGSLLTSISASAKHARTEPLEFSVLVTNPGSAVVPLTPCPVFLISLSHPTGAVSPDRHAVQAAGRLNCAAAPASLAPGASLRLLMRVDPDASTSGELRLAWGWAGVTAQPLRSTTASIVLH